MSIRPEEDAVPLAAEEPPREMDPRRIARGEKKQIYLRSVYPLNPGIPHFVDHPEGW